MAGKRADGEGTIFRLPNGRWRVVVDMGTDAAGKRRRVSRSADRKADALALLEQLKADRDTGVGALAGSPRLADYLEHWLGEMAGRVAPNTLALYRNAAKHHLQPILGGTRLDRVSPVQVAALSRTWREAGVGTRTQQVALAVLSQALQEAAEIGMIRLNPAAKVKRPADNRKPIDPFSPGEVKQILDAAEADILHYPVFVLLFTSGMRFGEVAGLPWRAVDLDARTVRIEQQLATESGKVSIREPKTKRSRRTIGLTPKALGAMVGHRQLTVRLGRAGDDLCFRGCQGGCLRHRNFLGRVWNPMLESAAVRVRPIHHARHTYATLSLTEGVPVHVVSAVLGHSRASVTLNTYAHYLPSHQQSATDAVSRLIG